MKCNNCGAEITADSKFCTNCGYEIQEEFVNTIAEVQDVVNLNKNYDSYNEGVKYDEGEKSKVAAGLLGIFAGSLGIHRFYLGYTTIGIIQIAATILTCGMAGLWGFIEGILILVDVGITTDEKGNTLSDNKKSKMGAGLLGIFAGAYGVHRFYLGYTTIGIIQMVVSILTCGIGGLWGLVEGILILCGSSITTDYNGEYLDE